MKNLLLTFTFVCVSFQLVAQKIIRTSDPILFDLIHTNLFITPDFTKQSLQGNAKLFLKPHFYPQSRIEIDAKALQIQEVAVNGKKKEFSLNNDKLLISFGQTYTNKDTILVQIVYATSTLNTKRFPMDQRGFYFVNATKEVANLPAQLWTQGETSSNSCWFPTLDSPNQKHTHEITLEVDDRFTTLSNGLLKSAIKLKNGKRRDTWVQSQPHSVYLTMMAVGEFEKISDLPLRGTEISYYIEPKFAPYAKQIFGRTREMMAFFERITGVPYPWPKYAQLVARDFVTGAMENTSATIHGDFVLKNPHQLVDNSDDGIIAHELFHHWFGNLATCESWSHLPLNESFADYSEYLWHEYKYGKEEAEWVAFNALDQYLQEAKEKQVPLIRFEYSNENDMFDSHSYAKGGRILHLLRHEIGDEAFFMSMQIYLSRHAYQSTEIEDFRRVVEEVTGQDMRSFFDQWFFGKGHVQLVAKHEKIDNQLVVTLRQEIDSLNPVVFRIPVSIAWEENGTWKTTKTTMQDSVQVVKIPVINKPKSVVIDPDHLLIGTINHEKKKEEIQFDVLNAPSFRTRLNALQALSFDESPEDYAVKSPLEDSVTRQLVMQATRDLFWKVRHQAVQLLFDYDGSGFLEVEKALQFVIKNDSNAYVRADAILAVKNFLNAQNDILFRQALKDTSMLVRGAALEAILINKPMDADSVIAPFLLQSDVNTFAAIVNYWISQGDTKHLTWISDQMNQFSSTELYPVMGLYSAYLVSVSESEQKNVLPQIKRWLLENPLIAVRYGAMQLAQNLAHLPEANQMIQQAVQEEKDAFLQSVYSNLKSE
ncbi:MAG: M1 family aminopeptidase [Spirosomataceae bacterium]